MVFLYFNSIFYLLTSILSIFSWYIIPEPGADELESMALASEASLAASAEFPRQLAIIA